MKANCKPVNSTFVSLTCYYIKYLTNNALSFLIRIASSCWCALNLHKNSIIFFFNSFGFLVDICREISDFNYSSSRRFATILTDRWRRKMMRAPFLHVERKLNVGFQTGPRRDVTLLHRCVQWRRKENLKNLSQKSFMESAFYFCNNKRQLPIHIIIILQDKFHYSERTWTTKPEINSIAVERY